MKQFVVAP